MTLENNRKAAYDFFDQIWNKKDESAIDRFIALDAAGNDPKFGVLAINGVNSNDGYADKANYLDLDDDGNGVLTKVQADLNEDGEISNTELEAYLTALYPAQY